MTLREQSPFWRRVVRTLARKLFSLAENNDDPRSAQNGERWLLRQLLAAHARSNVKRRFVVFDGGANAGDYTRLVLQTARQVDCAVDVHAFEPSPLQVETLRRELAG